MLFDYNPLCCDSRISGDILFRRFSLLIHIYTIYVCMCVFLLYIISSITINLICGRVKNLTANYRQLIYDVLATYILILFKFKCDKIYRDEKFF